MSKRFILLEDDAVLLDVNLIVSAVELAPYQKERFIAETRVELTTGTTFDLQTPLAEFAEMVAIAMQGARP